MKTQIDNFFSGITDEDEKQIKQIFKRVRINTNVMLRNAAKSLIQRGYYD